MITATQTESSTPIARTDLHEQVEEERRELRADSYSMSLGELASLDEECLRERAFRRYSPERNDFFGAFLISPFEVVACGIAYHLLHGARRSDYSAPDVLEAVKTLWSDGGFLAQPRTGMSAKQRLRTTIPQGRELFAP